MKVKTANLIGPALDWAVWKCAGGADAYPKTAPGKAFLKLWRGRSAKYLHPSTDWAQGGPIIDREDMNLVSHAFDSDCEMGPSASLYSERHERFFQMRGPTRLIAAMRCYVASKLGDEIDVPEELL